MFLILGLLALGTVHASPLAEVNLQDDILPLDTLDSAAASAEVKLQPDNDIEPLDTLDTASASAEVKLQPDILPLDTVHASPLTENIIQLPLDNVDAAAAASAEVKLQRGSCPMYWFGFNGHCYKYVATHMFWGDAEWNCVSQGANLVSIHSAGENNFVRSLINNFDPAEGATWIGLTDVHLEGKWMWSDGSKVSFTMWHGRPDNHEGREHCGELGGEWGPSGKWNDNKCYDKPFPSVCKSRTVSC